MQDHTKNKKNYQPDTNHFNTEIPYPSHDYCEICFLITEQQITDCIEFLEKLGYTGDTALFVLACLQQGGAA